MYFEVTEIFKQMFDVWPKFPQQISFLTKFSIGEQSLNALPKFHFFVSKNYLFTMTSFF